MNRELPQPGEKWRNFKGNEYVVIGIARLLTPSFKVIHDSSHKRVIYSKSHYESFECKEIWEKWARVFDSESSMVFWMRQEDSELIDATKVSFAVTPTEETWSQQDITEETIWARPLDNFMGIVSSSYGEQSSNCYRFDKII